MKNIIRAWKDPVYRATLSTTEQSELASPAGMIELSGTDLDAVAGGGKKSGKSSKSGKSGKSHKSKKSHKSHGSHSGSGSGSGSGGSGHCD